MGPEYTSESPSPLFIDIPSIFLLESYFQNCRKKLKLKSDSRLTFQKSWFYLLQWKPIKMMKNAGKCVLKVLFRSQVI